MLGNMRRRAVNLDVSPWLQLRFPLLLLAITMLFVAVVAATAIWGYQGWYETVLANQPAYLEEMVRAQTRDFLSLTALATLVYVVAIVGVSLGFSHRLLGPSIALRRQLEAMKNGDFEARVRLRDEDAWNDVANDLNDLAELLAQAKALEPSEPG